MPVVLEAEKNHYDYVLFSDRDKPEEQQPTFMFRVLTAREWKKVADLADEFDKYKDSDKAGDAMELCLQAVEMAIGGWRNMIGLDGKEIKFNKEKLGDIVTMSEALELMRAATEQGFTVDVKKKLELPLQPNGAAPAEDAPDKKNAKTVQAN